MRGVFARGRVASFVENGFNRIEVAPPPRVEVVPPPRVGYVWAPGHWEWVGGRHAWVTGVWLPARPGYVYHGPVWVARHGHWVYREAR
ncbi:YXWGXW repeat-containing protein [Achromobacter sp. Marseille-Q0513]|uniref:YXWGXW repeat-containing protein n=1 Tax=Achromobacter sp. Marseille-Q0513 TaxID=2829161 RepID=UPI001BA379C5|nr:YXWGXW repeat-containing protein [Achromobacter sp. Marseille-Q0513]MBR8657478.1 YXWGXW repeat-containing protein [Achromobacter sp. Marseille-Q0513]